ncbi:MAG: CoA-binding protein [Chloroflexi bacterium]|nr:CoA-binding protein [Chloroflexota bacterium]
MAALIPTHKSILDYAFYPRSVAVVGASDQPLSAGYHFLKHLLDLGFAGDIYAVNPKKDSILGVKAYPGLKNVPAEVDLVICCVSTDRVLPLLDECKLKNVKVVHLFTARLGETGRPQAVELERQIKDSADRLGINLIGPNCMGIYCPESKITFGYDMPAEPGNIGVVFQSGGAAGLLVQDGALLGLRFSKVLSYGNALQIDESDILDYLANDPKTGIIAAYFEGVRDGKKFMRSLKRAAQSKPVIAIKGGRGKSGVRAVASHTAAIAGATDIWDTAFEQAGVMQARDIDEMMDLLCLFNALPPIEGNRVGIIGGGGGKCIIAADLAEEAGLSVPPLSSQVREKLKGIVPALWDWLGNPVDFSIWGDDADKAMQVRQLISDSPDFDFLITQISDDNPLGIEWWTAIIRMAVDDIISVHKGKTKPVIAVLSSARPGYADLVNVRWRTISEQRSRLVAEKVPTFDTMADAVRALAKYVKYWERKRYNP